MESHEANSCNLDALIESSSKITLLLAEIPELSTIYYRSIKSSLNVIDEKWLFHYQLAIRVLVVTFSNWFHDLTIYQYYWTRVPLDNNTPRLCTKLIMTM